MNVELIAGVAAFVGMVLGFLLGFQCGRRDEREPCPRCGSDRATHTVECKSCLLWRQLEDGDHP